MLQIVRKRRRGVLLTQEGFDRLERARSALADRNGWRRATIDDLSALCELDPATISRVLNRRRGVDRFTLSVLFAALGLTLDECDFAYTLARGTVAPARACAQPAEVVFLIEVRVAVSR